MHVKMTQTFDLAKFRQRLRQLIQVQYGTASDFAKACGLRLNTVYRILNNDSLPTVPILAVMCDKLGCTMEFLLGISLESADSNEAYENAIMNVYGFRDTWTRAKILYLVYAATGMLSEKEEERLRVFLNLNGENPGPAAGTHNPPVSASANR